MRSRAFGLLVLAVSVGTPSVALANVGTPLIWATGLHMLFGNACIGVLEGALLAWIYKVPAGRAVGLMILANYFSAWLGWIWLLQLLDEQVRLDLYNAWPILWEMVVVAYLVTLVLEWPFVAGCFWGKEKLFRRSCSASLLIQSVSYVLLFGWYGLASGTSLYTAMSIVQPDQVSLPADVIVYFIADDDGDVYRREFATGRTEKVFDLNSTDRADCLSLETSGSSEDFQDLVALLDSGNYDTPKVVQIGITVPNEGCPQREGGHPMWRRRFPGPSEGVALRLGSARESPWTFNAAFWPAYGLSGENTTADAYLRFALETPFVQWEVRHATLLPMDRVLFQLGKRQICILDIKTRKIALIARGRGPVAVLQPPASRPAD